MVCVFELVGAEMEKWRVVDADVRETVEKSGLDTLGVCARYIF